MKETRFSSSQAVSTACGAGEVTNNKIQSMEPLVSEQTWTGEVTNKWISNAKACDQWTHLEEEDLGVAQLGVNLGVSVLFSIKDRFLFEFGANSGGIHAIGSQTILMGTSMLEPTINQLVWAKWQR